jgi:hypothetical protein
MTISVLRRHPSLRAERYPVQMRITPALLINRLPLGSAVPRRLLGPSRARSGRRHANRAGEQDVD